MSRHKLIALLLPAMFIAAAVFLAGVFFPNEEGLLKRGRRYFDQGKYAAAEKYLREAMMGSEKSSGFRVEAELFYATCFVRQNKFTEAIPMLKRFVADYPNSYWTPQAYFDIAYCQTNLGQWRSAGEIYRKIISDFPLTSWARYSQERLVEFKDKI